MASINIPAGATETATFTVQAEDLASAVYPDGGSEFPKVLATPRLVAFIEVACARLLQRFLPEGQLSVGAHIDLTHAAPTPVNAEVTIEAKYIDTDGKVFAFDVVAGDVGGEIGRAKHRRAVAIASKIEAISVKRTRPAVENKA